MTDSVGSEDHSPDFIRTIDASDLTPGSFRAVRTGEFDVLVVNLAGKFFAVENRCSHADSTLDGGRLRMGRISCPLHGAMFDVRTGASKSGNLVRTGLRTFATRIEDGAVLIAATPTPAPTRPIG